MIEASIERAFRNALIISQRGGSTPRQGPCGFFKHCGPVKETGGICPVCAALRVKMTVVQGDVEDTLCDLLEIPPAWLVSFLQGWDGDSVQGTTHPSAYKMGKRLWKKMGE